ncbi:MAG: phage tail tape measure protein [Lachnospiraceae bacterium]
MADGKIIIETGLDSSGIEQGISRLNSVASKGLKVTTAAIAAVSTALVAAGGIVVKTGTDFESGMSRVKAISGATGAEFEALKQQAIDLGASTAFSASEAAEGMENLASAGFSTTEIMEAMPGMLDLAASAGEDLGTSSDIAASTLRGFGLAASDAGHVADVLAKNAADTNAAVADTGEAMKYVAPVANAMGIEFEECAAAIGIMADAGIKGSQSGTSLRGAMSRLVKPTDKMAETMAELGLSFFDSEGKMISLTDMTAMLQEKTAGLTDEQRNNALVTLFGQESLSGMLALMQAGPEKLSTLTASYKDCDGAAAEMAATMQDNLKSALEEVGGAAETLAIAVYDKMSEKLKEAAKAAIDYVNQLTEAFSSGGINGLVSKAGSIFAELTVQAAKQAPKMINAAVSCIKAFAKGIYSNRKAIYNAAIDIVKALASGIADLLPKEIGEPIKDMVNGISDSLKSGGLNDAIKDVIEMFKSLGDAIGSIAEAVLPLLISAIDFIGDNFTSFVSIIAGVVVAMGTYNAAVTISSVVTKVLATDFAALGAAMLANPVGLIVAGLAAVAATLVIASTATSDYARESKEHLIESTEAVEAHAERFKAAMSGIEQGISSATDVAEKESEANQALVDELHTLVDANGQVKAGNEERVAYILGELNAAYGTEMQLIDGKIDGLKEETATIENLMAVQKAQTLLSNTQDEYAAAIELITGDLTQMTAELETNKKVIKDHEYAMTAATSAANLLDPSYGGMATTIKELVTQTDGATAALVDYVSANNLGSAGTQALFDALASGKAVWDEASGSITDANGHTWDMLTVQTLLSDAEVELLGIVNDTTEAYNQSKSRMDELTSSITEAQTTMANWEALEDALATGDVDAISTAYSNLSKNMVTVANSGSEAVKSQMKTSLDGMQSYIDSVKNGTLQESDALLKEVSSTTGLALGEFANLGPDMVGAIQEMNTDMVAEVLNSRFTGTMTEEGKKGVDAFVASIGTLPEDTRGVMAGVLQAAIAGTDFGDAVAEEAEKSGSSFLDALRSVLKVHSPSRAVKEIFSNVAPGATEGLRAGQSDTTTEAKSFGGKVLEALIEGITGKKPVADATGKKVSDSINTNLGSADTRATGSKKVDEYNLGISSKLPNSQQSAAGVSNASNTGLGSADTQGTGSRKVNEYNAGIAGKKQESYQTGATLSGAAKSGAESVSLDPAGDNSGHQYAAAVASNQNISDAHSQGAFIAGRADAGARSVDGSGSGSNFGQTFGNSVKAKGEWAFLAGAELGARAQAGLNSKSGLDINSPSRKARKSGQNFDEGLVMGIDDKVSEAEKASMNLGTSSVDALQASIDAHSPAEKTKTLGDFFGDGFILGVTMSVPEAMEKAKKLGGEAVAALTAEIKRYQFNQNVGSLLGTALANGIEAGNPQVSESIKSVVKNAKSTMSSRVKAGNFDSAGTLIVNKVNSGITKGTATMKTELQRTLNTIVEDTMKNDLTLANTFKTLGNNALNAFTTAVQAKSDSAVKALQTTLDKLEATAQTKYNAITALQDKFESNLRGDRELFTLDEDGKMSLTDWVPDNAEMDKVSKGLAALKSKIDKDLFDEIAGMSNTGTQLQYIETLSALSKKELEAYNKGYVTNNKKAASIAKSAYADRVKEVENEFNSGVIKALGTLQTKMQNIGTQAVAGFIKGFKSSNGDLNYTMKAFTDSIVKQIKTSLKIKSPSKVTEGLGKFTGEGFVDGVLNSESDALAAGEILAKAAGTGLENLDFSAISAKMKAAVAASNAKIGAAVTTNLKVQADTTAAEEAKKVIDYAKLGDAVAYALVKAGLKVEVGERELGRVIGDLMA